MIRTLVRVAVAALAVWLLASRVDLAAVGAALRTASPTAIVVAIAATFAANLVTAHRLRAWLASQGIATGVGQTFAINLTAIFYNLFVPAGGVGVAALRFHRFSRGPGGLTAVLTAMVCDRLTAIVAIGLVGLTCWMLDASAKPVATLFVLLGGLAILPGILAPRVVPAEVRRLVREIHTNGQRTWWRAALLRVATALGSVARLPARSLAAIIAISVLAQLPGIVVFAALGRGLGLDVPFVALGWVRSVVVLLSIPPISIGGLGVREGVLVLLLRSYGVAAHDALALSILFFATNILVPSLTGGLIEGVRWLRGGAERS